MNSNWKKKLKKQLESKLLNLKINERDDIQMLSLFLLKFEDRC